MRRHLAPAKLEDQLPLFDNPDVVLAYGSAGLMMNWLCLCPLSTRATRKDLQQRSRGDDHPALVNVNFIVAVTVMVRRTALDRICGFFQPSGLPYVDHPTWLRMATVGRFARSPLVLGNWRRYSRQVTTRSWFEADPDRASYLQVSR